MKKLVILTATRAEYGLLKTLIKMLIVDENFETELVVTGAHLSSEFGMTVKEIENDGIKVSKRIEILLSSDTYVSISKSMGLAIISFAEYFSDCRPDALLVLGDRYETLAVCCAAMNAKIPIFHLYGGETTEGVIDEAVRHSITKMSYLHFTSTEKYRHRVIQMGESPERVFNVGALGVENAKSVKLLSRSELEESIGHRLGDKYIIGSLHPVTLEEAAAERHVRELLRALDRHSNMIYLFTKANADVGGRIINKLLGDYAVEHDNFILIDSLGLIRYLSGLKHALLVIGNSSSGLIEAPTFHIPTINIGDRQKGRIAGETVIQCSPDVNSIDKAIELGLSDEFKNKIKNSVNPYGDGNTSEKIIRIIRDYLLNDKIDIKKKFYDIYFDI